MGDKVPGGTDKKPKKEKTVKDAPKDKKEAPKKKENSLDKSFKNIAFLTKADNTLINFYINKIKLFSTFIFLFVLTNLTLNVVDLYMFSLDFFNNLDSLCHPDEKRNYFVIFRHFHKSKVRRNNK